MGLDRADTREKTEEGKSPSRDCKGTVSLKQATLRGLLSDPATSPPSEGDSAEASSLAGCLPGQRRARLPPGLLPRPRADPRYPRPQPSQTWGRRRKFRSLHRLREPPF